MREIKFRAYQKSQGNKNMYYWSSSNGDDGFWDMVGVFNGFMIMQYTGLKDKNGVEIYEGDILKADRVDSENKEWIGVVEHNNFGGLCLYYNKYRSNIDKSLQTPIQDPQNAIWVQEKCEVIGNIYENPELLNNK